MLTRTEWFDFFRSCNELSDDQLQMVDNIAWNTGHTMKEIEEFVNLLESENMLANGKQCRRKFNE